MTQTTYPKIFISIMQHLSSKQRPLHMFDGVAQEVLDFKKEPATKNGMEPLNLLYDKLVVKDISYSLVIKNKPRVECPPIRMRGVILESPKRKVQVKGISEFISLPDGTTNPSRGKVPIPRSQEPVMSRFRESRETLRPDPSDSQYVAVPVTNHELQPRNFQPNLEYGDERHSHIRSALSKTHTSSTMRFGGAGSPRNEPSSPLPKSFSRTLRQSPLAQRQKYSALKLNYDSATKILPDDPHATALNPCMQVKKITERQPPKTPPRKTKQEAKPTINKQQFHIDPNLDKGIDCSFEALGSSEGRHSANPSTPAMSSRSKAQAPNQRETQNHSKIKRLQRYSSSAVDDFEQARRSGRGLHHYHGSNMSEQEDEQNETFGPGDRLQSIFTMNKKDSDLHNQARGGLLIIRGSSKEMMTMPLKPAHSKDLKKFKQSKEARDQPRESGTKEKFKLPKQVLQQSSKAVVQKMSSELEAER